MTIVSVDEWDVSRTVEMRVSLAPESGNEDETDKETT